jgi:tetratricopeptide (TPR) repeat protein
VLAQTDVDPEIRVQALIHRGIYYNQTRRYRDAIRDFDGVVAASQDRRSAIALAALADRAYADEMLGQGAAAMADADRIVMLAPDNAQGYDSRAFLHQHRRQFALAALDYDGLVRLKPDDPYALNNRCWLRAIANQLPGALQDCDQALALDPHYAAAIDSRAFVYFRMGRYAKARDEYDAAVLAGSYVAATFYMRGVTKLRLGAPTGGIADIQQAKSIDPDVGQRFAEYGIIP